MDDDEVVDYLIMEALATKQAKRDEETRKQKQVQDWKADKSELWKHARL